MVPSSFLRLFSPTLDIDERIMQDRRQRPELRARFEEIRREIAERVRDVCRGMAPEECDALLSRMARVQLKYELASVRDTT